MEKRPNKEYRARLEEFLKSRLRGSLTTTIKGLNKEIHRYKIINLYVIKLDNRIDIKSTGVITIYKIDTDYTLPVSISTELKPCNKSIKVTEVVTIGDTNDKYTYYISRTDIPEEIYNYENMDIGSPLRVPDVYLPNKYFKSKKK